MTRGKGGSGGHEEVPIKSSICPPASLDLSHGILQF
jgi:hypothetical protein